ncbi:(2Fe-2S)-binding protein [Dyella nitratireducens]|uniref:Oxidoreductase n=1 Tax=Dyella nitratireducens TaxID=1849580 RepID=A0ABQ1FZ88_9GAMM|nr:(2Fe-2S)-binding protein [Dyella nitratireducens]GGA34310.1 oxidoreductase [Dyella nitratireducens]GLQ40847.1 oxidoreductase [Dyella nitratireducens]
MAQDHAALPAKPTEITPTPVRAGIDLQINGERYRHTGDPAMPLLWYLRDVLQLDGTKYGGEHGDGGADLVLVNGKATSAINTPMSKLAGKQVITVEGLADARGNGNLHPLQQAFIDEDAIGCGYCTPGWLIASMELLNRNKDPSDNDIDGLPNLCRCGCQTRVRQAIKRAAAAMKQGTKA